MHLLCMQAPAFACMHACTHASDLSCMHQVKKDEVNDSIDEVKGWISAFSTHQAGLKTWRDNKKGLVN